MYYCKQKSWIKYLKLHKSTYTRGDVKIIGIVLMRVYLRISFQRMCFSCKASIVQCHVSFTSHNNYLLALHFFCLSVIIMFANADLFSSFFRDSRFKGWLELSAILNVFSVRTILNCATDFFHIYTDKIMFEVLFLDILM